MTEPVLTGWLRRALGTFRPSLLPALLVLGALLLLLGFVGFAPLMVAIAPGSFLRKAVAMVMVEGILYALILGPLISTILLVAAALPSRVGFRAVLLVCLTLSLGAGLVSCSTMPAVADDLQEAKTIFPVAAMGAFTYGPAAIASIALTLATGATIPLAVRRRGREQAIDWLRYQLTSPGWLLVSTAAESLGVTVDEVRLLVADLVLVDALPVRGQGAYYVHRDVVATHMERLVDAVREGHQQVSTLAATLGVPDALASSWLDELAMDPDLPLTVDRARDRVLWDIAGPCEMSWCARCGGPEHPVGGGLLRCVSCGWERDP